MDTTIEDNADGGDVEVEGGSADAVGLNQEQEEHEVRGVKRRKTDANDLGAGIVGGRGSVDGRTSDTTSSRPLVTLKLPTVEPSRLGPYEDLHNAPTIVPK